MFTVHVLQYISALKQYKYFVFFDDSFMLFKCVLLLQFSSMQRPHSASITSKLLQAITKNKQDKNNE